MNNKLFIKLLKEYTNIDSDFIDVFFKKFVIGEELDFHVKDIDAANYLGITLTTLRERLQNKYSKNKLFFEKVDFVRVKNKVTSSVTYMLNYSCFERLAMSGKNKQSETVRMYFVKLREFLVENQNILYQSMTNKDELKKYNKFETIYFFAVDERHQNIFKLGRTTDIVQRLRNYNVGRIKEIELKYLALVKNNKIIERCIKLKIKKNQIDSNKEIYKIEPQELKKIIDYCYCKHVSKSKNEELYQELSELLGLYSYTKDKIKIRPYIIIGSEI